MDICAISEHWLFPHSLCFLGCIDNDFDYAASADRALFAHPLPPRGQGGVALLWRKSINASVEVIDLDEDRIIGIKLNFKDSLPLFIFSVYLPPVNYDLDSFIQYIELLTDIFNTFSVMGNVIFMSYTGTRSTRADYFQRLTDLHDLVAVNDKHCSSVQRYTFESFCGRNRSVIDYIFMPSDLVMQVTDCHVCDDNAYNLSDHLPVICNFNHNLGINCRSSTNQEHFN